MLIDGAVEIRDDNGEVTGYQEVRADGDVWARTVYHYENQFSMSHEARHFTGKKRYGIYLKAGNGSLPLRIPEPFPCIPPWKRSIRCI